MIAIRLRVEDECYMGELTGEVIYYTETVGSHPLGAVLGRGYSERESLEDFARRANMDGWRINPDPELMDTAKFYLDARYPQTGKITTGELQVTEVRVTCSKPTPDEKAREFGAKIEGGLNWTWAKGFSSPEKGQEFVKYLEKHGYENRGYYPAEPDSSNPHSRVDGVRYR